MGTDIHGWIEIKTNWGEWAGLIKIDLLVERNRDLFGCLFGVTNHANFKPIAAQRGFPSDLSEEVTQEILWWEEEDGTAPENPTWITWEEIKGIDWEEESVEPDSRAHRYRKTETGELEYVGKGIGGLADSSWQVLERGETLEVGDIVFKLEKIKRKEILASAQLLFSWMEKVAKDFKEPSIRLVVWFDS